MSWTVDANVLRHASDDRSPLHEPALAVVGKLAGGPDLVYVFWPVVMAYLRIATHPRVFEHPLEPMDAFGNIAALVARPHVRLPGEGRSFWSVFADVWGQTSVRGDLVPDAHVVALMRAHGVRTIWTRDRDFRKFDGIEARDPFA